MKLHLQTTTASLDDAFCDGLETTANAAVGRRSLRRLT